MATIHNTDDDTILQIQDELRALQRAEASAASIADPEERQYVILQIRHKLQDWIDLEKEIMGIQSRTRPTQPPPVRNLSSREGRISYLRQEASRELRSLASVDPWVEVKLERPHDRVEPRRIFSEPPPQAASLTSPSAASSTYSPSSKAASASKRGAHHSASYRNGPWPFWDQKLKLETSKKDKSSPKQSPKNPELRKKVVKNRQALRKGCELMEKSNLRALDRDTLVNVNVIRERVKQFEEERLRMSDQGSPSYISPYSSPVQRARPPPQQRQPQKIVEAKPLLDAMKVNFVRPLQKPTDRSSRPPHSPSISDSEVVEYFKTFPPKSPVKVGRYRVTLSPAKNEISVGATLPPIKPPPRIVRNQPRGAVVNLLTGAPLDLHELKRKT